MLSRPGDTRHTRRSETRLREGARQASRCRSRNAVGAHQKPGSHTPASRGRRMRDGTIHQEEPPNRVDTVYSMGVPRRPRWRTFLAPAGLASNSFSNRPLRRRLRSPLNSSLEVHPDERRGLPVPPHLLRLELVERPVELAAPDGDSSSRMRSASARRALKSAHEGRTHLTWRAASIVFTRASGAQRKLDHP
jgi:hypothetical protein